VGKVRADRRGKTWYLTYHEHGQRLRPRVGTCKETAKQLAAEVNAQLQNGAPSSFNYEPINIGELQARWLNHHEQVLRSSVQTINRYRTATNHLLNFISSKRKPQKAGLFQANHAEEFVDYLRTLQVAPNGHPHSAKRPLMDKGIKYILLCCRTLFNFAIKRRYLSAYAENPFSMIELDRMPVENFKRVILFNAEQERQFLDLCDEWQFPLFLTLMLTGLRPGELTHLVLPDDVDWEKKVICIQNKSELGWQVKTRNERLVPLVEPLMTVLKQMVGGRQSGLLFQRRQFVFETPTSPEGSMTQLLQSELSQQLAQQPVTLERAERQKLARRLWTQHGLVRTDRIRIEYTRLTSQMGLSHFTAPKMLRHLFATALQEANVDPLVRCELMGHSTASSRNSGHGLGMTAHYTQTRPETRQKQLELAMRQRPAYQVALERAK